MSTESPEAGIATGVSQARPRQFGKYLLLEKIGSGGMAEIFKAVARGAGDFQKVVVIKRILLGYSRDPSFVKMFVDEARITAPLQHANIVSIYEFDEVDGQYFLAMELVNGRDLQRVMARANKLERRIPEEIAVHLVGEVCKALWYAYNARDAYGNSLRIIHRDVSPSNVLLSYDGEVKVTDFGVAKAATSSTKESGGGVLKGKLGYMSPEQVLGRELDHRSDIFSLGIILFEILTLKRLFLGKSDLQTLINVRDADIEKRLARHPELPAEIAEMLRKALARDPERRYRSAMDLLSDLQDWLYARNKRVGQGEVGAFMRDLFPEESEQEILPLETEEATDSRRGEGPRTPTPAPAASRTPLPAAAEVRTPVPAAGAPSPGTPEGTPRVSPRRATPSLASASDSVMPDDEEGMFGVVPNGDASRQPPGVTRNSRLSPRAASFRIRAADGAVFGPVSFENVLSLLDSRAITEEEMCSVDGGEWMRVGDVGSLRESIAEREAHARRHALLFEGSIDRQRLVRLITNISREKRLTGLLTFKQGSRQKEVYFREGRPRYLLSNLRHELLGEFLVRRKIVTREQIEAAIAHSRTSGCKLGDGLMATGAVRAHEMADLLNLQFRERFLDLFNWEAGWYGFFENAAAPRSGVVSDLDPVALAAEAVRTMYPAELVRAWLADHMGRRIVPVENARVNMSDLHLLPREMRIVSLLDQHATLQMLLNAMRNSPEMHASIYRVVFLLLQVGVYQFRGMAIHR